MVVKSIYRDYLSEYNLTKSKGAKYESDAG